MPMVRMMSAYGRMPKGSGVSPKPYVREMTARRWARVKVAQAAPTEEPDETRVRRTHATAAAVLAHCSSMRAAVCLRDEA